MFSSKIPLSGAVLAALTLAVPAFGGTITGDAFTASMADDSFGPIELDGSTSPVSGTAGLAGVDLLSDRLEIDWLTGNTFTVRVIYAADLSNLKISINDLNFKDGVNPVNITGVTFDDAATDQEQYNGYEGISGPAATFAANSIEVSFAVFPTGPAADAIPWHFNVVTDRTSTSVPDSLPASMVWVTLGGLGLLHRRLQRR